MKTREKFEAGFEVGRALGVAARDVLPRNAHDAREHDEARVTQADQGVVLVEICEDRVCHQVAVAICDLR